MLTLRLLCLGLAILPFGSTLARPYDLDLESTYYRLQRRTNYGAEATKNPVQAGDVLKAKPKHFIPRQEGVGNVGQHPVIALTYPDAAGYVPVAPMSHDLPAGTPARRASVYGLPIDPVKGESEVSIGQPKLIHQNDLKPNNPPVAMSRGNYMALITEISKNYDFEQLHPAHPSRAGSVS